MFCRSSLYSARGWPRFVVCIQSKRFVVFLYTHFMVDHGSFVCAGKVNISSCLFLLTLCFHRVFQLCIPALPSVFVFSTCEV